MKNENLVAVANGNKVDIYHANGARYSRIPVTGKVISTPAVSGDRVSFVEERPGGGEGEDARPRDQHLERGEVELARNHREAAAESFTTADDNLPIVWAREHWLHYGTSRRRQDIAYSQSQWTLY